jgi:hypothetical protein
LPLLSYNKLKGEINMFGGGRAFRPGIGGGFRPGFRPGFGGGFGGGFGRRNNFFLPFTLGAVTGAALTPGYRPYPYYPYYPYPYPYPYYY